MTDKVKVKPLVWVERGGNYPCWRVTMPVWGGMFDAKIDKSEPLMSGRFPLVINGKWDGKKHQTLKSAQASGQSRYESALER